MSKCIDGDLCGGLTHCFAELPGTDYVCNRRKDHDGDHISCCPARRKHNVKTWPKREGDQANE